jgi:homocysteine S-methyltransferase
VASANNAYSAEDSRWLAAPPTGPEGYALCMRAAVASGARLVGGCCGTGPEHIAAVAAMLAAATR